MRIFAAIERILLDRWRKIKYALKINKWPLLNLQEQRLQLKKQYLESLFRKKWHKFVRSIYDSTRTQVPPLSQNNLNMDGYDTWVAVSDSSRYGSLQFTITARTQMRLVRLSIVCEHLLASQLCPVSLTQSCVTQMGCVVLLKYHVSLSLDCYN